MRAAFMSKCYPSGTLTKTSYTPSSFNPGFIHNPKPSAKVNAFTAGGPTVTNGGALNVRRATVVYFNPSGTTDGGTFEIKRYEYQAGQTGTSSRTIIST